MSVSDLGWLLADQYLPGAAPYQPYQGFQIVESDIRAAHPDKYTPITIEDSRFSHPPSWIRIHAWATTYLHLWCIKPHPNHADISGTQRLYAIFLKPATTVLDATINTLLFPIKLTILIDRIVVVTTCSLFRFKQSKEGLSIETAWINTHYQMSCMLQGLFAVVLQPATILANVISPRWDFMVNMSFGGISYDVFNKTDNKTERILDQGKVKYLRERCGWQDVTDEMFKTLNYSMGDHYHLSYFSDHDELRIDAHWKKTITVGTMIIITNYNDSNH